MYLCAVNAVLIREGYVISCECATEAAILEGTSNRNQSQKHFLCELVSFFHLYNFVVFVVICKVVIAFLFSMYLHAVR